MTGTITLTAAMRANLLSLQNTGAQMATTQLALSTGNKVNSALDNPVNFFAAQALNSRASSLSALLDGMGQAIQTIQATNQGITTLTTLANQLTSIANAAKVDLQKTTTVNTLETAGLSGIDSAGVADLTLSGTNPITTGDAFSLQDGTGVAHTFTIDTTANGGTGTSLQNVVDAINQVSGFNASIVYGDGTTLSSATVSDGTGTAGPPSNVAPLGTPNGDPLAVGAAYLRVTSTDGKVITATDINGGSALTGLGITAGASTAVTTGGNDTADVANYASVIAQIDQTVTDANYQGNNLIDGLGNNLTVQVNELSQGAITVNNTDLTATTGLGLDATAHNGWGSTTDVNTSIDQINAALAKLATTASGFANSLSLIQTRQDFTNNLVNTLKDGSSQLTIADKNEEGASMLALQTQQQLGIEALSLSSQANQSVLRLFG